MTKKPAARAVCRGRFCRRPCRTRGPAHPAWLPDGDGFRLSAPLLVRGCGAAPCCAQTFVGGSPTQAAPLARRRAEAPSGEGIPGSAMDVPCPLGIGRPPLGASLRCVALGGCAAALPALAETLRSPSGVARACPAAQTRQAVTRECLPLCDVKLFAGPRGRGGTARWRGAPLACGRRFSARHRRRPPPRGRCPDRDHRSDGLIGLASDRSTLRPLCRHIGSEDTHHAGSDVCVPTNIQDR